MFPPQEFKVKHWRLGKLWKFWLWLWMFLLLIRKTAIFWKFWFWIWNFDFWSGKAGKIKSDQIRQGWENVESFDFDFESFTLTLKVFTLESFDLDFESFYFWSISSQVRSGKICVSLNDCRPDKLTIEKGQISLILFSFLTRLE